ncbi:hypothetical protein CUS11_07395 [Enterococcus faecium]|uniref:hypothetical protein n=1 Tax=Enterococcus faecium TaxID=1352 RepID=UPI000CF28FA3|nr:hypothetical protein [Enterococcus faecium]PQE46024.1 hypothetical protein CUS11_07395 [Enterococcus faecium]
MDVETLEALYMDAIRSYDTKRAMVLKRQLEEAIEKVVRQYVPDATVAEILSGANMLADELGQEIAEYIEYVRAEEKIKPLADNELPF